MPLRFSPDCSRRLAHFPVVRRLCRRQSARLPESICSPGLSMKARSAPTRSTRLFRSMRRRERLVRQISPSAHRRRLAAIFHHHPRSERPTNSFRRATSASSFAIAAARLRTSASLAFAFCFSHSRTSVSSFSRCAARASICSNIARVSCVSENAGNALMSDFFLRQRLKLFLLPLRFVCRPFPRRASGHRFDPANPRRDRFFAHDAKRFDLARRREHASRRTVPSSNRSIR